MLGVGPLTAAMTLWRWFEIPRAVASSHPIQTSGCILIWGGSTITGQIAIQLCVQSGLEVIAVASKETSSLVESLGAAHAVARDDKTDDELVAAIKAIAGDSITRALDLVGGKVPALCLKVMSSDKPCLFAPLAMMSSSQEIPLNVKVVNVEMKQFVLDKSCMSYMTDLNSLVENDKLRLPQLEILYGGLGRVEEGLSRLKRGNMMGRKLVIEL